MCNKKKICSCTPVYIFYMQELRHKFHSPRVDLELTELLMLLEIIEEKLIEL
jgi:hypothetical protein